MHRFELFRLELAGDALVFLLEEHPAEQGTDTRFQHRQIARLADEVVGARFQPARHVFLAFARGQHEDDGGRFQFASRLHDALAGFDAVHLRHHEIEQDGVIGARPELLERFVASTRGVHVVPFAPQFLRQKFQIRRAVVHGQQPRARQRRFEAEHQRRFGR
jgi:hypothetical protein